MHADIAMVRRLGQLKVLANGMRERLNTYHLILVKYIVKVLLIA